MPSQKVALFGEAEKGSFRSLLCFSNLPALADTLGHPPEGSLGLHLAIQTLLFQYDLIFIRVKEEGFCTKDYIQGLHLLKTSPHLQPLSAICLPGVGDADILHAASELCHQFQCLLMTTEKDFYDYITSFSINKSN